MMRKDIKVIFMGTPDFALSSLEELYNSGYNVCAVFTKIDKPCGRGMKVSMSPVKEFALEHNIPIYQPTTFKNNYEIINIMKEINPDFIAVTAYGKILPKAVLDIPKYGCINVHGSLLPKYRGSAPIQWSIINGDLKTGVTTMFMDVGMDTGDMLLKEEIDILEEDNLESVYDRLKGIGGKLLVKTLDGILDNSIKRIKQGDDFTIAPMISKDMTKIDFNKSPREIFNFVRGLNPFPGTFMLLNDKIFKVGSVLEYHFENLEMESEFSNNLNGTVVYISKKNLVIKCNNGFIEIKTIKPENSKMMDIVSFINGNKVKVGDRFL